MSIVYFPAVVEQGPGPGFGVFFPDLPGCVSAGRTLQETARNAEEALRLHIQGMLEDRGTIPQPSDLDDVQPDPEVNEAARILVRAELPSRQLRVNITLDEGLLEAVDATATARGMTRSGFLAESARRLMQSELAPAAEMGGRWRALDKKGRPVKGRSGIMSTRDMARRRRTAAKGPARGH